MVEILFVIFDAQVVICVGDGIRLSIDSHQVVRLKIYMYKSSKLDDAMNFE